MSTPPHRFPRAPLALLLGAALTLAAVAAPAIARWAAARRLAAVAEARGLAARWDAFELGFPARLAVSRLAFVDPARGDTVFHAESLSVALDPLSLLLLQPRPRRIVLAHARGRAPQGRSGDPDTLAPEEPASRRGSRERSDRVPRAAESLVRALLLPARRLPAIELRDVAIASGREDGEPGDAVLVEWLDLKPGRAGIQLAGAGRLQLATDVPFAFNLRYGNDDRVRGGARFGIFDPATGRHEPLRVTVDGSLVQDRHSGVVRVAEPTLVTVGRVPLRIAATLERRGPRLDLRIEADSLTEERIVASVPRPMLGPLVEVHLTGRWDHRLGLRLDASEPDSVWFDAEVIPHGLALDPERTGLNLLTLDQPFTAEIRLPRGRSSRRELSSANPSFRPLERIDSLLVHAVITNEDGAFFRHRGFNPEAVKGAIAENMRAGAYRRGAGTITMQLVRNLYLGHDRTLSRKAQEVALAWMLERLTFVSKRRLLEIYLNVIEWGPGVHGADEAARYYFGHGASRLTLDESLFLTTVIPSPGKWRHRLDPGGSLRPFQRAQMHFIGRAMVKKGWLAAEELPPAESLRVEIAGPAREMLFPGEKAVAAADGAGI